MAQNGTLSRKQERAITALLTEPTVRDAARAASCSERSLFRFLADPDFQEAYRAARHRVVEVAIGRLQQAGSEAVDTLRDIMQGQGHPASARVTAARSILEFALRGVEAEDLSSRLAALEEYLEGSTDNDG